MAEIGRRIVHSSGILIPALYLLDLVGWTVVQGLLVLGTGIALILEYLRLRVGLDWWIYRRLTRPYEAETVAGYALYMMSITVVGLVFEPVVAIPAMLMLMIGDPISGLVSSGEFTPVKGWQSWVAMFVVSFLLTLPFALEAVGNWEWALGAAIVGAGLGTVADGVKPTVRGHVVDDNLTIPIAGAVGLWVTYAVFPL